MLRINKTLIAALLLLLAAPALYADRYERTFSRTQTYQGGRISIDHSMGPVTVRAGSGNEVRVHALIRASDSEIGKDINVTVSAASANGITIQHRVSGDAFPRQRSLSYSVDIDVTMPANAPLTVHNRFGNVDVTGIHAAGEIVNAQGNVTLRDSRGAQRVENSFGVDLGREQRRRSRPCKTPTATFASSTSTARSASPTASDRSPRTTRTTSPSATATARSSCAT